MANDVFTSIGAISDGFGSSLGFLPDSISPLLIAVVGFVVVFSVVSAVAKLVGHFF